MTCIRSLSNQRFMLPNIRIINPKYRAARTRKSASPSSYLLRRAVSCASHLFLAFIPCPFQLNLILFLSALTVEYEELVEALFLGGESRVDSVRDIVISSSIGQAQQSHIGTRSTFDSLQGARPFFSSYILPGLIRYM
jgi:hypothetical protein